MSDRMLVATRKGLLIFERSGDGWEIARTAFAGDARGSLYAALTAIAAALGG